MKLKCALVALGLLIFISPSFGKKTYPITLTVTAEQNVESKHASFSFRSVPGLGSGAGVSHNVTTHVTATGSDGNLYDLVPENKKDEILPGQYPARFDGKEMIILRDKKEIKYRIAGMESKSDATK